MSRVLHKLYLFTYLFMLLCFVESFYSFVKMIIDFVRYISIKRRAVETEGVVVKLYSKVPDKSKELIHTLQIDDGVNKCTVDLYEDLLWKEQKSKLKLNSIVPVYADIYYKQAKSIKNLKDKILYSLLSFTISGLLFCALLFPIGKLIFLLLLSPVGWGLSIYEWIKIYKKKKTSAGLIDNSDSNKDI